MRQILHSLIAYVLHKSEVGTAERNFSLRLLLDIDIYTLFGASSVLAKGWDCKDLRKNANSSVASDTNLSEI